MFFVLEVNCLNLLEIVLKMQLMQILLEREQVKSSVFSDNYISCFIVNLCSVSAEIILLDFFF